MFRLKAPFSRPNNSLPNKVSGMAPHSMEIEGPFCLGDVNLAVAMKTVQADILIMRKQNSGRIISMSSITGCIVSEH